MLRCTVTVTSEIGRVTVSKSAMLLQSIGASQRLTAKAAGQTAPVLTWMSSNPAVARVSADGVVTAVGDGETVIMAITPEGRADRLRPAAVLGRKITQKERTCADTFSLFYGRLLGRKISVPRAEYTSFCTAQP